MHGADKQHTVTGMEGKRHSEPESEELSVEESESVPGELQPWGQVSSVPDLIPPLFPTTAASLCVMLKARQINTN